MEKENTQSPRRVLLLTCISAISFFLFGYDTGVVSGAFEWVRNEYDLSDGAYETLVGSTTASAALGALIAAGLNEKYGRKPSIIVAAALFGFGAALMALLPSSLGVDPAFLVLLLGRVLLGIAIGIATVTVPMYISEAAPPEQRGFLLIVNDLSVVTGQFIAGLVNIGMDRAGQLWRVSIGCALLPGVIQLIGFAFLPESPRWLFQNGGNEEARAILLSLRSSHDEVEEEIQAISEELEAVQRARRKLGLPPSSRVSMASSLEDTSSHGTEADGQPGEAPAWAEQEVRQASLSDLTVYWKHLPVRRAMTLGIVLMAMNQFSGINTVMYYSVEMMEMAGFSNDNAVIIACLCDFAQMVGVCYSLLRMDVDGRRHLALQSATLVAPTLLMLSISFWVGSGWLALVALMLYLPAFGSGLSGVPWTVNSEIYSIDVRSVAVTQATACNWLFNSVVSFSFVSLSKAMGAGNTFLLYLVCCIVGGAWMYKYMPETNSLGLEETASLFVNDSEGQPFWRPRCFSEIFKKTSYERVDERDDDREDERQSTRKT